MGLFRCGNDDDERIAAAMLSMPPAVSAVRRDTLECVRARNIRTRPTTALKTAALSDEPAWSTAPRATSTLPDAAEPDDPMTSPVNVRWATLACASPA